MRNDFVKLLKKNKIKFCNKLIPMKCKTKMLLFWLTMKKLKNQFKKTITLNLIMKNQNKE